MALCLFASDLHGRVDCYAKLFAAIEAERPAAVFLGGDLLPNGLGLAGAGATGREHDRAADRPFLTGFLAGELSRLRRALAEDYPAVFAILGNDDPRIEETAALELDARGLWHYAHLRRIPWGDYCVFGYSCVPPTPFRLKDWERYDVSRFVDPGCSSPEEGWRTVPASEGDIRYGTIQADLEALAGAEDLARAIVLLHAPPYESPLDRAALDNVSIDHVPLDVHIGSIAVRRFILAHAPLVTLHGHVHESARLTGQWRTRYDRTHAFSAAHDGPELALIRFDPARLDAAARTLA